MRSANRGVHVGHAGARHVRQMLARRGIFDIERRAIRGGNELAIDEQMVRACGKLLLCSCNMVCGGKNEGWGVHAREIRRDRAFKQRLPDAFLPADSSMALSNYCFQAEAITATCCRE
jgi:hypothetical protein